MRVSTSFQSPFLISYLSVIENVYFPLMLKGVKDKETIALDCLKRVSLEDKKERDVISLSGGEKMRVSIARALTLDSEILLFDEPTGELDDKTSLEIFKLLKQLASDHIVIIVTHDRRYAIDPTKIHNELGWLPATKFNDGIKKTINWYLTHKSWWEKIISGEYQNYYEKMYKNR